MAVNLSPKQMAQYPMSTVHYGHSSLKTHFKQITPCLLALDSTMREVPREPPQSGPSSAASPLAWPASWTSAPAKQSSKQTSKLLCHDLQPLKLFEASARRLDRKDEARKPPTEGDRRAKTL